MTPGQLRRTFLNALFREPPREVRPPEYEPGWMQIMVWRSRMLDNLRPPPRPELRDAWNKLMNSKRRTRRPLNSTQALQCRRLLEYLSPPGGTEGTEKMLTTAELALARSALLDVDPVERTQNHRDFAKALHDVWARGDFSGKPRQQELQWAFLVKSLAVYGGASEALEMLYSKWDAASYAPFFTGDHALLQHVAQGLAREGNEADLAKLVKSAESHGVPFDVGLQKVMTLFFAQRDRVPETQFWFHQRTNQRYSLPEVYQAVASFARRNKLHDWAMPLFLELGRSQPKKRHWDALLQAMLLLGKSLEEVTVMMSHMLSRSGPLLANINTINGLLRASAEMQDAALADSILHLAAEKGLAPNGETWLVVLQLRLAIGDLAAAQELFLRVHRLEPWNGGAGSDSLFSEYRQVANEYLVALCRQKRLDFRLLSNVLQTADEGQVGLDAETVATLCLSFLENDENFQVMDTLSAHSFLYSEQQRLGVQSAFVRFCLDPSKSTRRVWGAYQILDQYFQDLSVDSRTKLIAAFFDRKRPDMAAQVISKMRRHRHPSFHPTMETYILCLEGFARHPDAEGLQTVHNMMKTDTTIQLDTRLHTALMLAYTGCGQARRALDFWKDIAQSPEGPSYATIGAVFWALEHRANGYKQAREIWNKIEQMDLEIPASVYNAYIGAVANGAQEKEVRSLIMKMASVVGSEADEMT